MLGEQEKRQLDRGWLVLNMVWAAMLMTLVAYLVLFLFFGDRFPAAVTPGIPPQTLRNAFLALSVATLIGTRYLRGFMLKKLKKPGAAAPPGGNPPLHPVAAKYTTLVVISLAISESVGIYGVVLFLVSRNVGDLVIFIGLSAAAMIYYRPKKEELAGLL